MEFGFSEEQDEFRAMVRRFFEQRWPLAEVRRLSETPAGFDRGTWKQMAEELGLQGLALPEACGGQGFGFLELGIALEEMGRQLAGGPFLASAVLGAQAIRNAASEEVQAELLPALASGDSIASLAVFERSGPLAPASIPAECRSSAGGWRVSGEKDLVIDGQNADLLVVAARAPGSTGDDGIALLAVRADAPGVETQPVPGLDLTRKLAHVTLREAPARLLAPPGAGGPALARTLDQAALALAAEAVGAAARCLEMAVDYARGRVQFARPIGSFQAIQHKAAEVLLELESARSAAYWSWWVASRPEVAPEALAEAASLAKATCGDALTRAAAESLQIHGGVGFTWESDCHLYYRRAKAMELLFGDPVHHRARLAVQLGL
jgi:alkylation response protein AidB-like acyl-CoA dehydrogenase